VTKQEAEDLERFRLNIERADLPSLLRVVQSTLEDHVQLLRRLGAPDSLLLMALALAIELNAREGEAVPLPSLRPPPLVGSA
jgi:hypothetical protein